MKKIFKFYAIIWVIALAVFNIVCFVSPSKIGEFSKFGGTFWIGYIFITIAFLGQLGIAYKAFDVKTRDKLFLNISLISVSYTTLIAITVCGVLCMAIPGLPNWIGIIACFAVLAFGIISIIAANAAIDTISDIDDKIKTKTAFIKSLTADCETLVRKATTDEVKSETKRVFETIRYSDPVSNVALNGIEKEISMKFEDFSAAVECDEIDNIKALADEVCNLLITRNAKCKGLKK